VAASRPYWKGYLKLSLVSCPIALYNASSSSEPGRLPADQQKYWQSATTTARRRRDAGIVPVDVELEGAALLALSQ
jgi:hypothetical protein